MEDTVNGRTKVVDEINKRRKDLVAKLGGISTAIRIDLLDPARKKRVDGAYFFLDVFKDTTELLKDFDNFFGPSAHKDCNLYACEVVDCTCDDGED